MNLNNQLIWMVVGGSGLALFMLMRQSEVATRRWRRVYAGILVLMGIGWVLIPDLIGYIGGVTWPIVVVLPALLHRRVAVLASRQEFAKAACWLRWLGRIPMIPAQKGSEQLWTAMAKAKAGDLPLALAMLEELMVQDLPEASTARIHWYRLQGMWDELRDWLETAKGEMVHDDPELAVVYLRTLGETGALHTMVSWYEQMMAGVSAAKATMLQAHCRLFILAYCGRVESVRLLFAGVLRNLDDDLKAYWVATAEGCAGQEAVANEGFSDLATRPNALIAEAANWRLKRPLLKADGHLLQRDQELLEEVEHEITVQTKLWYVPSRSIIVYVLIAVNLAVFALEIYKGGSMSVEVLYELGALLGDAVVKGDEWWRLVTACFLHAGYLHVTLNMLALLVFGRFVERMLGHWRFLLVYATAGFGSMLVIVIVQTLQEDPHLVVGASGGIMGIIGAMAAILWRSWQRDRLTMVKQRLTMIGLILCLQTVFDLVTPQVSFTAHFSGMILGFLATTFLRHPGNEK